jgi:hypothetical protein
MKTGINIRISSSIRSEETSIAIHLLTAVSGWGVGVLIILHSSTDRYISSINMRFQISI